MWIVSEAGLDSPITPDVMTRGADLAKAERAARAHTKPTQLPRIHAVPQLASATVSEVRDQAAR